MGDVVVRHVKFDMTVQLRTVGTTTTAVHRFNIIRTIVILVNNSIPFLLSRTEK